MPTNSAHFRRVLFVRIGWMRFYAGPVPGDPRPVGGGGYNVENIGSEVCNFKRRGTRLYGFFETPGQTHLKPTRLERIDARAADASSLDRVLVVFVSRKPHRKQVVVGWYRNATVLRIPKVRRAPDDDYIYNCVADVTNCVLLPDGKRTFTIPWGAGAMGESNTCYPLEADGSPKNARWMQQAVEYVVSYHGDNLLARPVADAEEEIAREVDVALSRAQGRFAGTPEQRKALERYAVKRAIARFRAHGFVVEDVGSSRSYDLSCRKNGRELRVEVKATTTTGEQVVLTPREARLTGNRALFVVHSIKMKRGKPSGGTTRVVTPWTIARANLKAVSYLYTLPPPK